MARRGRREASGYTILVVDDQIETLVSSRRLFEHEGHQVLTAESGEEALEIIKSEDVHVIIVDYFMPRMTGGQFVEYVRRFDPLVQIILQTGYSGEKPPQQMLEELEIQGYHDKADDPERLMLWVQVAVRTHCLLSQLKQREHFQQELVANCSHEFRTPLNIISGYADLLDSGLAGDLEPGVKNAVSSILEATRGLTDLVTDFLSFSKIQAHVDSIQSETIATRELADELTRQTAMLIDKNGLTFDLQVEDVPDTFDSDPIKVRTILRNLIGNAIKFTAEGGITMRIWTSNGSVVFSVLDTGCGIPEEDIARVFEPFRQLDGSSTRNYGGVGLGLAICAKMARLLEGRLDVESEVGAGSTFTLTLPISPTVAPAAGDDAASAAGALDRLN